MARGSLNVDAIRENHRETGPERDRVASGDLVRGFAADDRRVRLDERPGGLPRFPPSKTLGMAIVLLAVVMALIIAFVR